MKKLMLTLVVLALGASALASAPAARAGGPTFGHWAGSGDRDIPIVNSTTAPWLVAFDHAVSEWSASTVVDLVAELGVTTKASRSKCAGTVGTIRVCNYPYGKQKGWAGLAKTAMAGDHIVQARVKLNQSVVKPDSAFAKRLTCHEVGHAVGLEHSSNPAGCLTPILNDATDQADAHYPDLFAAHNHADALLRSSGDIDVTITHKDGLTIRTVKIYPPR